MDDFEESINKLEELIYNENSSWEDISELIDVESFLKYYFLIELAEDPDRFTTSTFFYKDGIDDVIHIGPIWDSDLAFGSYKIDNMFERTDYTVNMQKYRKEFEQNWYIQLYKNKEFVKLLNEAYQEDIYPAFVNAPTIIDNYVNNMPKSIEMNLTRWNKNNTLVGYYNEIQKLKDFLQTRTEYMKTRYSKDINVLYTTYIRDENSVEKRKTLYGWESTWKRDGQISGFFEEEIPIVEDIKIILANSKKNENIKYDIYTNEKGWLGWKYNGNDFGTSNSNTNISGIKIELEGMPRYKIAYRVYLKNSGWQNWKYDGQIAGIIDKNQAIQGIQIKLELKK